jgi:2-polyprenyl-6-methoxyphenol hydroxylase-like FAD-dependent oxidoreductase
MLPNKKVSNITSTSTGVTVECTDGTSYEGSIIIGADGAHSKVRQQMRTLAMQSSNGEGSTVNAENPFLTTFRALWMRFPTNIGLTPGQAHETHGDKLGIQLFAGDDTAVMGMYERLPQPTRERHRYNQEDEEALINRWGHLPLTDGLTVRDAYNAKLYTGFVDLEEGVVEHWSWNRIVLAGDAAHKFTPSTGSGCNNGIADVVVLVNELHKIISSATAESAEPTVEQLTTVFKTYQEARHENVAMGCQQSGNATAMATWQNTVLKIVDKYVMPNQMVQKYFMSKGAITFSKSPVFDFVYGPEPLTGEVPWVQPILASKELSV